MRVLPKLASLAALFLCFFGTCVAQSLADAARQQQALKKSTDPKPHGVITNDDLSPTRKGNDSSTNAKPNNPAGSKSVNGPDENPDRPTAEEVSRNIKMQRQQIAELESRAVEIQKELEPWKTSDCTHVLHIGTSQNACDVPPRLTAELEQTKSQIAQGKKDLQQMQEDARKMGFPNSVYDPN